MNPNRAVGAAGASTDRAVTNGRNAPKQGSATSRQTLVSIPNPLNSIQDTQSSELNAVVSSEFEHVSKDEGEAFTEPK